MRIPKNVRKCVVFLAYHDHKKDTLRTVGSAFIIGTAEGGCFSPRCLLCYGETHHRRVKETSVVTGLFQHHAGRQKNIPIVRTGNLAAMDEEEVVVKTFGERLDYCDVTPDKTGFRI